MPRRRTSLVTGEFYHVYNRGANRQTVFSERSNFLYFLRLVRRDLLGESASVPDTGSVRDAGVEVICYALMPNHCHLLVKILADDFSERMKSLGQSFTEAINRRQQRTGPLFEGRFQAVHVDDTSYLLHLSRYIHLNPVRAGLVQRSEDWEFSSYREYVGIRCGSLPRAAAIIREAGGRSNYRDFVESSEPESVDLSRFLMS